MKYGIEVRVRAWPEVIGGAEYEWRRMRPSGKPPYAWDTREEAERMLRMTHADPKHRAGARIVELEGEG